LTCTNLIAGVIITLDDKSRVSARMIVDADLTLVGCELGKSLLLGLGAHPRQIFNVRLHRGEDVIHHVIRTLSGFGGEFAYCELLSQGLTERTVGRAGALFPTLLLLLLSGHVAAVEVECLVAKRLGQNASG
jgi:hypothetical protein